MLDRETWTFVNTFAPWLSAVGTIAAVVVSLYLAQRSGKIKIRVSCGIYRVAGYGQSLAAAPEYLQIRAVNHGFREATIQGIMWQYGKWRTKQKLVMAPPVNPLSARLPARLAPGESASFLFTMTEFKNGADALVALLRRSGTPHLAANRLRVGVYTTTGEEILASVDSQVLGLLIQEAQKDAP